MMWCRIYQLAIEKELDTVGSVQRPFVVRHLKQCSECRAFMHRLMRLEDRLCSAPSLDISNEHLAQIENTISRRLEETVPQATKIRFEVPMSYRLRYVVSAAAMVILILLAGLYFQSVRLNRQVDPVSGFVDNAVVFQARLSRLAQLPEQSFRGEMQKLVNDARSAAVFLGGCMPGAPTDINSAENPAP